MKLFLILNFVFVFLILTASFVTDFILRSFDLMRPQSTNEIIAGTVIRGAYLAGLVIAWLWFRFSWKKKFYASLDPDMKASMNYGRERGRLVGLIVILASAVFFLLKFYLKM